MDSPTINDELLSAALAKVKELIPVNLLPPTVAIVCGSGLSTLGSAIEDPVAIPYADLPGFLTSQVEGHQSLLVFGRIGTKPVVAMLGRFHVYEGHSVAQVTLPIRLFSKLGCKNLILTNAAGSLNPQILTGTVVAIHDHLSLPNMTNFPTAYFLSKPPHYSRTLRKHLFHSANALKLSPDTLAEGTYCWVTGPTFETATEGKFLQSCGGDVVGASTVPEVLAARQEGMEVLALSLVTNMVTLSYGGAIKGERIQEMAGPSAPSISEQEDVVSHSEVLSMGLARAETVKALVVAVIQAI